MPSFEKNKASGLWSCRFRERREDGTYANKRLSGFSTKKDAQYGYEDYVKSRDEREEQERQRAQKDPNDLLFDDLAASFLEFKKKRVKESSYYDIRGKITTRIIPYFTGKKMSEITPKMISDWIENMDYKYSSKAWIFSTLSSMYKYGVKYYDISNIMIKVDRPRNMELDREMEIWTPQEFKKFSDAVPNDCYRLLFTTLYVTGCRRGEGAALTWADLDEKKATLRINKSVTNKTASGSYLITTPKNKGSVRTITIPAFLVDILRDHKIRQREEMGSEWGKDCFIFGGVRPVPTSTADYLFRKGIQDAGVKKIRIHDLRHSCASLLISRGVSVVAVSRQLGHSNIEQTLNTYSHMMPDDKDVISRELNYLGTLLGTEF